MLPLSRQYLALRAVKELGLVNKWSMSRKMGMTGSGYAEYMLTGLLIEGYLSRLSPGTYKASQRGEEALDLLSQMVSSRWGG